MLKSLHQAGYDYYWQKKHSTIEIISTEIEYLQYKQFFQER